MRQAQEYMSENGLRQLPTVPAVQLGVGWGQEEKSLSNALAQSGIKNKGPFCLRLGFRHIFFEGALSRAISSMDHFMFSDSCELTGCGDQTCSHTNSASYICHGVGGEA